VHASEMEEKSIAADLAQVHRLIEITIEEKKKLLSNPREAEIGALADAYRAGENIDDVSSLDEQLRKYRLEADVMSLALTKQQAITADLRGKLSRKVCEHSKNVATDLEIKKRIVRALIELAEAGDDERRFVAACYEVCSSVSFRPMRVKAIGSLADPNSLASMALR